MKNILFKNDKSTVKDEVFLGIFIVACLGLGGMIYAYAPNNWFVSEMTIRAFGLIFIITGVLFIPGFIYRIFTNDKKK